MLHIVRRLSIVTIVALCLVTFAFAQAQQQARPAGQAAPAAQAAKDSCWGRSPCLEDHRPPVAFREDWTDPTPGVPSDYKDKDLDAHLQNKNLQHGWYGLGAKDVIYDRVLKIQDPKMYEDALVEKPDLTKIDEIGFTDLMLGGPGFTSGTSRVDWIEVHANRVKRPAGSTNNNN